MAFHDVDTSGKVTTTDNKKLQNRQGNMLEDDDEDSYEELSHSLQIGEQS